MNAHGQTIAILEFGGGLSTTDLSFFCDDAGIATPDFDVQLTESGLGVPFVDEGADQEVLLDVDIAAVAAPGAHLTVWFAPPTEYGWIEALTKAIYETPNSPCALSISWGWVENEVDGSFTWSQQALSAISQCFQEAALLGVTAFAASGDEGTGSGVATSQALVNYPASDPWVTGCGGSTLLVDSGPPPQSFTRPPGALLAAASHGFLRSPLSRLR